MSPNSSVIRTLYAAIYRLAVKFDQKRASKALLYRLTPSADRRYYKTSSTFYYSTILDQILGSQMFYSPNRIDNSFKSFVRSEFRRVTPEISAADRITAGFAFLRKFSTLWVQYENSTGRPRKRISKDEKFVIQYCNKLSSGVMLCAHPMVPGYMQRAIVLLLEHNEHGSYGIIINKKTDHNVDTSTLNMPKELLKYFGKNSVFFGGNLPRCQILHPFKECGGKLIPGCSTPWYDFSNGSIQKALEIAAESPENIEKFYYFIGCCVWKPGMLEQEVADGTWIVVEGEVDKVITHAYQEPIPDTYAVLKRTKNEIQENILKSIDGEIIKTPATELHGKDIYEGGNETWSRVLWSLSRQTNHYAHLDPLLDSSVVDSIDWHYSDEIDGDDEEDDSDED